MAAQPTFPPIRACLCDMDGLLINSEDLYTLCTNEILHQYGKPDLPWNIKAQLQGRPGPAAGKIFHEWARLPITWEEFMTKQSALQRKYFPSTAPLPGVPELLRRLSEVKGTGKGEVSIALATSSHRVNFELKTRHLEDSLFRVFAQENRVLGDDPRIGAGRGKPAPDIWLVALETINAPLRAKGEKEVLPEECLVFEDSVPGVESGRRAGMRVVWCPHEGLLKEYTGREEQMLAGQMGEHKEKWNGKEGEIGDGWAVLVNSLEGFDLGAYGIGTK